MKVSGSDIWTTLASGGVLIAMIRWIYRRIRNQQITNNFVWDMATNHLPHIYDALTQLCEKEGIELGDPPPIQFVDPKNLGKD